MTKDEVLDEFRAAGALLEGHFVLSSGRHSSAFLQCARVMQDANRAERLCGALARMIEATLQASIDMVVSPAMGGVIVGYEIGRQLGRPSCFFERVEGVFQLRRGFEIPSGARCLMAEDVVTTGLSSRECIEAIRNEGGDVVAGSCLIDRSGGKADIGVPLIALASVEFPSYPPDRLPAELSGLPAVKPGSRDLVS